MKGIEISDDFRKMILASVKKAPQKVVESTEPVASEKEEVVEEEVEVHACPLCESALAEPISEEKIREHVEFLLSELNEALENDGGSIDEGEEEELEDEQV